LRLKLAQQARSTGAKLHKLQAIMSVMSSKNNQQAYPVGLMGFLFPFSPIHVQLFPFPCPTMPAFISIYVDVLNQIPVP